MPHDMEPSDLVPVRNALTRLEYVEETALQPSTSFRAVMLRLEYQLQELKTDIAEENEEWLEDVKSLEQANQLLRAKNEDLEEQVKHIRANFDTRTVMAKRLHAENEDNFAEMLYLQGVE
ncbi:tannase [Marssonina coronariae]|uniref:Tannase n=1 Tax=Diplocarpon coronariae TaxID=2795749 RepID=A0A218ZBG3_9HELO|nr:tannase [Marssonina coronariae]